MKTVGTTDLRCTLCAACQVCLGLGLAWPSGLSASIKWASKLTERSVMDSQSSVPVRLENAVPELFFKVLLLLPWCSLGFWAVLQARGGSSGIQGKIWCKYSQLVFIKCSVSVDDGCRGEMRR